MKSFATLVFALILAAGTATAQNLTYEQKQACDRQERNQKEGATALELLLKGYEKNIDALSKKPELLVQPSFIKQYIGAADEVLHKCDNIKADLEKSACPAGNARVKALTDWCAQARASAEKVKAEIAPKLLEMEKLADPKSYPNLEADFAQIDALKRAYTLKDLRSRPDHVVELAKDIRQAALWANDTYQVYRSFMVVTGGKESAYYRRFDGMSSAIKSFQAESTKFAEDAKQEIPEHLKQAEALATQAAEKQQPGLITGGARQQFELAETQLKVWRALVAADDKDMLAAAASLAAAKQKAEEIGAALKQQILADERPPAEVYDGDDKEQIRGQIAAQWKQAWPQDDVVMIRMNMKEFDRRETATWEPATKSWRFEDRSTLCVTVIVKTNDKIATSYPAYVNVDNRSKSTSYGMGTKGGGYVIREMLLANVK